jgi:hypothetical protein
MKRGGENMNKLLDQAYITASRTFELWLNEESGNVFVVSNKDGISFKAFPNFQEFVNWNTGSITASLIDLNINQYNNLENISLNDVVLGWATL